MMKKTFAFLTAILAFGLLISTAYAKSSSTDTSSTQQQSEELTINCGDIYNVAVYEIKGNVKKTIMAKFDDETNEIIINGVRHRWSSNPYYEKEQYGKISKYKYTVAGYYFNWEYEGNGNFKEKI